MPQYLQCLGVWTKFDILNPYTVKLVYTGHSREPENVTFIYRLKLYALFINEKNETALYRQ